MAEKEFLIECFRRMLRIRRFEEKAAQVYQEGKFGGFCHLYIGQEAVVVGCEAAMRPEDYLITGYRDHGHGLVRGVTSRAAMAELYGKATGCARGKGGSMHFFHVEQNYMGGWGIVGGQIPLAAGLAFASRYRKSGRLTVGFLGDGAVPQGVVYETFNLAALWKLPLVVVVENNQYAMGTPLERSNAGADELYRRAEPFGIDCSWVDGMDVATVHRHFQQVFAKVRETSWPAFVEVRTYRYRGHSMSDPIHGVYRSKEEVEKMKELDPVARIRFRLEGEFKVPPETLQAIDEELRLEVDDAVRFAEDSPVPDPSELMTDVYV